MLLNIDQVKGLLSELKEGRYDVGLRDLSYVILCRSFADHQLAFRALFHDQPDLPFELYDRSDKVNAITSFLEDNYPDDAPVASQPAGKEEAISFDDLKQGLIDDMKSLEALRDMKDEEGNPTLEPKEMATVVGRIADIRVKLTDKYGATQKEDNHRVVVISKYSSVCPYCHKEF